MRSDPGNVRQKFRVLLVGLLTATIAVTSFFPRNSQASCLSQVVQELRDGNLLRHTFRWEVTENIPIFHESPDAEVQVDVVETTSREVEVIQLGEVDPRVLQLFVEGNKVYWPLHPNNKDPAVPFHGKEPSPGRNLNTRFTASRSLLVHSKDLPSFSIKMGTDHPHLSQRQPTKANMSDVVKAALLREPHIEEFRNRYGEDPVLIIAPEVLVLRHRETGQGVTIRDLSALDNDRVYVPALSIPYIGKEIASRNGSSFVPFWKEHYGALLGRAKARLLLKYGLEMSTPNAQNFLVELDRDFKPTGRIVFRDTVDSHLVTSWARALGRNDLFDQNYDANLFRHSPKPQGSSSVNHFSHHPDKGTGFHWTETQQIVDAHDQAWVEEIRKELRISDPSVDSIDKIGAYLSSSQGQQAWRDYHERLRASRQGAKGSK